MTLPEYKDNIKKIKWKSFLKIKIYYNIDSKFIKLTLN